MPVTREGKLSSGELKNKAIAGLDRGLILSAQLVVQRAKLKVPIDTRRLKRSLTQGRPYSRTGGRRAIDVGTNVAYAAIQEFGGRTKPHIITPRVKQALAFNWPNAPANLEPSKSGKYVFKWVNHPGSIIKAQPYLRPAINESKGDAVKIIVRSVIGAMTS